MPILGLLSVILCVAIVAFQVGRHQAPPARVVVSSEQVRVILVPTAYRPAEPNHQGKR